MSFTVNALWIIAVNVLQMYGERSARACCECRWNTLLLHVGQWSVASIALHRRAYAVKVGVGTTAAREHRSGLLHAFVGLTQLISDYRLHNLLCDKGIQMKEATGGAIPGLLWPTRPTLESLLGSNNELAHWTPMQVDGFVHILIVI